MRKQYSYQSISRPITLRLFLTTFTMVLGTTLAGFSTAYATAIAEADIQAQLNFSLPTNGVELTFFDSFAVSDTTENGNASAAAQAPDPLGLANGVQLETNAIATSSPTGSAFGIAAAFGSIELINSTPNPIDVDFTLVYDWTIQGSADDQNLEQAQAGIALDVFINDVLLAEIFEDNSTPPNFSMGSGNLAPGSSMTQVFSDFSIPSGTTFVDVAVAAQAEASSAAVPEPSTFLLLGTGDYWTRYLSEEKKKMISDNTRKISTIFVSNKQTSLFNTMM